jgi:hypothetical protein
VDIRQLLPFVHTGQPGSSQAPALSMFSHVSGGLVGMASIPFGTHQMSTVACSIASQSPR